MRALGSDGRKEFDGVTLAIGRWTERRGGRDRIVRMWKQGLSGGKQMGTGQRASWSRAGLSKIRGWML